MGDDGHARQRLQERRGGTGRRSSKPVDGALKNLLILYLHHIFWWFSHAPDFMIKSLPQRLVFKYE